MNEQIKKVIQGALLSTSEKRNINLRNLSICMSFDSLGGGVFCEVLDKEEIVGDISWKEILGIKFMAFTNLVVGRLAEKMVEVCKENNIDVSDIRVRFYAISNSKKAEPKLHLFEQNKPIKALNINEFI